MGKSGLAYLLFAGGAFLILLFLFGCPQEKPKDNGAKFECANSSDCAKYGPHGQYCMKAGKNISWAQEAAMWKDEYRCLRYAECGCFGENNTCAWQVSAEVQRCIDEARNPPEKCPSVKRLSREQLAECERNDGRVEVSKDEKGCELEERCEVPGALPCTWGLGEAVGCPEGFVCELAEKGTDGKCEKLDYIKETLEALPTCKRFGSRQCAVGRVCGVLPENTTAKCFRLANETVWYSFCGALAHLKCPDGYRCRSEGDYPFESVGCEKMNLSLCGGAGGGCAKDEECRLEGGLPRGAGVCVPATSDGPLTKCQPGEGIGGCAISYVPVCAKVRNASGAFWREYINACSACASNSSGNAVAGYNRGKCA